MCRGLATLPATCLKSAKDIKHKIGFLLQKPDALSDQKHVKERSTVTNRGPAPSEVQKWKESFNNVMNSEGGRAVFTDFLKSEFSQENMEFWNACEEYKKTPSNKMAAKAKQIYNQYVETDAPNEVNLDSATREETRQNLESAGPSCFDEAQKKIFTLMEKDSYRRFLLSKLFRELSSSAAAGPPRVQQKRRGKNASSEARQVVTCGA